MADTRAGKYLCFRLGKDDFGIGVAGVREIMPMQPLAVVPQTPAHLKGIMNLRGRLIPVIDLKRKLGAAETEPTPRTSIVVVQVDSGAGPVQVGMIVDAVIEVLQLKTGEIDNPPREGSGAASPYLIGTARVRGKPKFLLEVERVMNGVELPRLETVGA